MIMTNGSSATMPISIVIGIGVGISISSSGSGGGCYVASGGYTKCQHGLIAHQAATQDQL